MEPSSREQPNLDKRTISFTIRTSEDIRAGDTLIVRDVRETRSGVQISAVTEKAVRDEAAKLFQ